MKEFKEAVRRVSRCVRDNLETMLMHPDAAEALVVDRVQRVITSGYWATLFPKLSTCVQKRATGRLWRLKDVTLGELRSAETQCSGNADAFDAELGRIIEAANTRKNKKETLLKRDDILNKPYNLENIQKLDGRAPYSPALLRQAYVEVLAGKHPKEEGGCLFRSEQVRARELNRRTEEQTNNHLIRHRLLILERVLADVIKEYADGDKNRVRHVTIEVNRDLRELSGKDSVKLKEALRKRLENHSAVVIRLQKGLDGTGTKIGAGLIRKGRIAEDLGWRCPYTGKQFEPIDLVTKRVDKDHIIPRSLRPTDSLESLVLTFSEVNAWKRKRTALQFIQEEGGKPVPGTPAMAIMTSTRYREFVEKLEIRGPHEDDKKRKKRRKELMLVASYEEKEFTPKDLTITSQLVRLGAQKITKAFADVKEPPKVVSLPGSVTGTVRKGWNVLGCLALANPAVLDENGALKTKTEIREVTHLHHALDACVLVFAAHFIPNNGRIWELIIKRRLAPDECAHLQTLGIFEVDAEGRFRLRDLPAEYKDQIRQRLNEKRVVQHIPARMDGLRAEQNVWRIAGEKDGKIELHQWRRNADGKRALSIAFESASKLIGPTPEGAGKLLRIKGALVIADNFGVALDPKPTVIPFHKVPSRLRTLRRENNGEPVRVLRNGQLIQLRSRDRHGIYKILSVANKKTGIVLKYGDPDLVRRIEKPINYYEASLKGLLEAGLTPLKVGYCGISSCEPM